jgi:hypothetical protein
VTTGKSDPPRASPESLRDESVRDLAALIRVVAEVRNDLRAYEAVLKKVHQHLSAGSAAAEVSSRYDVGAVRAQFTQGLNGIERARGTARLSLWRLQLSEGSTITDIARAWGLSRQFVSRALAGTSRTGAGADADAD